MDQRQFMRILLILCVTTVILPRLIIAQSLKECTKTGDYEDYEFIHEAMPTVDFKGWVFSGTGKTFLLTWTIDQGAVAPTDEYELRYTTSQGGPWESIRVPASEMMMVLNAEEEDKEYTMKIRFNQTRDQVTSGYSNLVRCKTVGKGDKQLEDCFIYNHIIEFRPGESCAKLNSTCGKQGNKLVTYKQISGGICEGTPGVNYTDGEVCLDLSSLGSTASQPDQMCLAGRTADGESSLILVSKGATNTRNRAPVLLSQIDGSVHSIDETLPVGNPIFGVTAMDPDGDKLWYGLSAGEDTLTTFEIDTAGTLRLKKSLAPLTGPLEYFMTVVVTDSGPARSMADLTIRVTPATPPPHCWGETDIYLDIVDMLSKVGKPVPITVLLCNYTVSSTDDALNAKIDSADGGSYLLAPAKIVSPLGRDIVPVPITLWKAFPIEQRCFKAKVTVTDTTFPPKSSTFDINVCLEDDKKYYVNSIDLKSQPSPALQDQPATILCDVRVDDPLRPTVHWSLNDRPILNKPGARVTYSKMVQAATGSDIYKSELNLRKVKVTDSGIVKCAVELGPSFTPGRISNSTQVDLGVIPLPRAHISPLTQTIRVGSNATVNCSASYPDGKNIIRAKVKLTLKNSQGVQMSSSWESQGNHGQGISDSIRSVDYSVTEDIVYNCIVSNQAGSASSEAHVSVYNDDTPLCPAETDDKGLQWLETKASGTNRQLCPIGYKGEVTRKCTLDGGSARWEDPNYTGCIKISILKLAAESEDLFDGIQIDTVAVANQLQNLTSEPSGLGAGDLSKSVEVIRNLVSDNTEATVDDSSFQKDIIASVSNIIDSSYLEEWGQVTEQKDLPDTTELMETVDTFARGVSLSMNATAGRIVNVTEENVVFQAMQVNPSELTETSLGFPLMDDKSTPEANGKVSARIDVRSIRSTFKGEQIGLSYVHFKTLDELLPADVVNPSSTNKSLYSVISDVLSLTISAKKDHREQVKKYSPPIVLKFQHSFQPEPGLEASCRHWDFSASAGGNQSSGGAWSTSGCVKSPESNDDFTICECDHLTNFAILMSPSAGGDAQALSFITKIGCGISIACLFLLIILYIVYWNAVKSDRSILLLNLCVSLLLADLVFVVGVERTESKVGCVVIAALLHLFFLTVFCFMLMEGIEIYRLLVEIFSRGSKIKYYVTAGWGIPIVTVALSLGITQTEGYGTPNHCWLSLHNGAFWAFAGPALIIIAVNTVFLILAIRALLSAKITQKKTTEAKLRQGVRALCILMPLLGITWVFGIFAINEQLITFQYIFTILNSFQGLFIFIVHCMLNKQLRNAVKNTWTEATIGITRSTNLSTKSTSSKAKSRPDGSRRKQLSSDGDQSTEKNGNCNDTATSRPPGTTSV